MKFMAPQCEGPKQCQKTLRGPKRGKGLELSGRVCRGYCKCVIRRLAFFKQESTEDVKILFMFTFWKEEDQSQWL